METCDRSPNSEEAIERKKLRWKCCFGKFVPVTWEPAAESHLEAPFTFSLSLVFLFFFTRTSLCRCQRDPMLSMCARGSRRCRFVLVGPDRSPACREHYCLVLSPSFPTGAQNKKSREAEFLTLGFPLSFFFFLNPPPPLKKKKKSSFNN